jgi:phosphate/sulfate permease
MTLAGALLGIMLVMNAPLNSMYMLYLFLAWGTYPLVGLLLSGLLYKKIRSAIVGRAWRGYIYEKIALLVTTGLLAYVFGANTLGLIFYLRGEGMFESILFIVSVALGFFLLGREVAYEIGLKIYNIGLTALLSAQLSTVILIEMATQLGIPVSLTQLMMISLIGPAITKKFKIINVSYVRKMVYLWVLSPIMGGFIAIILFVIYSGLFA